MEIDELLLEDPELAPQMKTVLIYRVEQKKILRSQFLLALWLEKILEKASKMMKRVRKGKKVEVEEELKKCYLADISDK